MDLRTSSVGESHGRFQSLLNQSGMTFQDYLKENYLKRWAGDDLYRVMALRTSLVNAMHNFLVERGLLNMEKVSLSPLTDPLAHDVEHVPTIYYKGHPYHTTHSMIYAKFLACFNPEVKGVFVDSPNIRLELESAHGTQRKKYVIDFSQMDIELRRNRGIDLKQYLGWPEKVKAVLGEDMDKALDFFEDLVIAGVKEMLTRNEKDLEKLGVALELPKKPFPRYPKDAATKKYGAAAFEKELGKATRAQFFWVTGLLRENYDLVYPYLLADGTKVALADAGSDAIYNYDLCAQGINRKTKEYAPAYEVLSGALREWLYKPIVERLLDNRVIPARPEFADGNIANIEELDGYGPFLLAAAQEDAKGQPLFPETMGGGVGIERLLFALCQGERVKTIEDVMLFGKNPDSHPLYLF